MRKLLKGAWLVVALFPAVALGQIRNTKHDLSSTSTGPIKAATDNEICKFCHIPHNAVAPQPLWGHALPSAQYQVPQLRSKGSTPAPQPDGSSRLCLSCHDGTVALGDVGTHSRPSIPLSGVQRLTAGHRGYIGTDLSGSHPISFRLSDADPRSAADDMGIKPLAAIESDRDVRLDRTGKLQCTTCHNPHSDRYFQPGRVPHFSVKPSTTEICLVCHALQ